MEHEYLMQDQDYEKMTDVYLFCVNFSYVMGCNFLKNKKYTYHFKLVYYHVIIIEYWQLRTVENFPLKEYLEITVFG